MKYVNCSGNSSFKYLQNIIVPRDVEHQPMALALTEDFIQNMGEGACRVHCGGFAETIQIFMPEKSVENYINFISPIFGVNNVNVLDIRLKGISQLKILEG